MDALITGISGFAGGHLAEHLLCCGDRVLGCARSGKLPPGSAERLHRELMVVGWDLGKEPTPDPGALEAIRQFAPQCIYHLAAISVPRLCGPEQPTAEAIAVNVEGTRRVLELAAGLQPAPRVLFVSTSHVYAPVGPQCFRVDEAAPVAPRNGYGRTKLEAERLCLQAHQQRGLDVVVARAFQHTGPRQGPLMMLPEWARQFALPGDEPVKIYSRDTYLDLTDVRDTVRAYRLLIQRGAAGQLYNVGSAIRRRTGDILELLLQLADPRRQVIETRPGIKHDPIADNGRLVERTGWQPLIPLEQTVADTLHDWQQRVA